MSKAGSSPERARAYHHGALRSAVLRGALEEIEANGPSAASLRSVARRAGVSHSAPQHHFRDKPGLLSAVAADGWGLLADATAAAWADRRVLLDVGLAYIRFAISHRAHFEVMFRPELYRPEDPEVAAARDRAGAVLFECISASVGDDEAEHVWGGVVGVWSFVHGFASLWLNGNFYAEVGEDPEAAARTAVDAMGRLVAGGAFGPGVK